MSPDPQPQKESKEEERRANAERYERLVLELEQRGVPAEWTFAELSLEHSRIRSLIVEMQTHVIRGRLDFSISQGLERRLVHLLHALEERARTLSEGRYVPRPGE